MPKTSRSEQMDFKGLEIIADEFTGTFNGEITGTVDASNVTGLADVATSGSYSDLSNTPDVTALTDSSGGTSGGDTVAVIPAATADATTATAADLDSVNAAITAIKNDIATLAAKLNALIAAL